jgi:hypothetical protein
MKSRNYCRLCETKYHNFEEHKKGDTHKEKLIGKFVVKNNGKEYYYDKNEKYSTKERLKDPERKKRHYNLLQKKVNCDRCNSEVIYSSLWRHKKSIKCISSQC